jgi:hypothetical protein
MKTKTFAIALLLVAVILVSGCVGGGGNGGETESEGSVDGETAGDCHTTCENALVLGNLADGQTITEKTCDLSKKQAEYIKVTPEKDGMMHVTTNIPTDGTDCEIRIYSSCPTESSGCMAKSAGDWDLKDYLSCNYYTIPESKIVDDGNYYVYIKCNKISKGFTANVEVKKDP